MGVFIVTWPKNKFPVILFYAFLAFLWLIRWQFSFFVWAISILDSCGSRALLSDLAILAVRCAAPSDLSPTFIFTVRDKRQPTAVENPSHRLLLSHICLRAHFLSLRRHLPCPLPMVGRHHCFLIPLLLPDHRSPSHRPFFSCSVGDEAAEGTSLSPPLSSGLLWCRRCPMSQVEV